MTDEDKALVDRLFAMADEYDSGHHESWPTIDALEIAAHRIEAQAEEIEKLRMHLDVALETLAEEGVCGDECNSCKEARAALGETK